MNTAPAVGPLVGPYRIIKAIGAGGSARIDLARIERAYGFQRHVVIKRPLEHLRGDPTVAASLRREAHLGGQLRHPNLVAVLDAGVHDGYDYLALEYIHGASLRTLMQVPGVDDGRVRTLPLGTALSIVIEIARGLHEAHELAGPDGTALGLVHRDVSPNNVLIGADGTVKLADFGIAKDTRVTTLSGSMRGTVTYMAPEQCRGHAFDRRADVFSLGVILFELVTSRRLFWADNDVASLHKVLSGVIPDPRTLVPAIAPELAAILVKAVAADPAARPATTAVLADELEGFAARARLAASPRFVARAMAAALGVRAAPWLDALPVTARHDRVSAEDIEASLVGIIQSTPDEPEPEFSAPVPTDADPIGADEPAPGPGSSAPEAMPVLRSASAMPLPQMASALGPMPAPPPRVGTRAEGGNPHARQHRIAILSIGAAVIATVVIVAFAMRQDPAADRERTGADGTVSGPGATPGGSGVTPAVVPATRGAAPRSTPSTPPATASDAAPDLAVGAARVDENAGVAPTEPDASPEVAAEHGPTSSPESTNDGKQRQRRRLAREAAAKAALERGSAATPETTPPGPADAGVPNDAKPARVEWNPNLLLPTDPPKPTDKPKKP